MKKFYEIISKESSLKIIVAIFAVIGAAVILFLTNRFGAGTTPDSAAYISAAKNLADGNGFLTYNGTSLVAQPPLYPIVLAVIKKITSIDPLITTGYLNAFLFGAIIYFSGLLLLRYVSSYSLVILGTISVMISYVLVQASLMALTESLFILLVILFLYFFERYKSQNNFAFFFLFSASVALACLTRYTGVILIPTGVICIFLWGKNTNKEKVWHSLEFILISATPVTVWLIRNYFVSGTFTGERAASSYTFMQNLEFFYQTVLPWYLPISLTSIYSVFILVIVTTWILLGLEGGKSWYNEVIKVIGPSLLFVMFYSGIIVVSSTTTAYDKISDRLLSPIYIPIIFIFFFVCDKILTRLAKSIKQKNVKILFILGIVTLMIYPIKDSSNVIDQYVQLAGWGYTSEYWKKSETINYIAKHPHLSKSFVVYSNEPAAIYILANMQSKSSPAKTYYNSPQLLTPSVTNKNVWEKNEKVFLIWFDDSNRSFLYTIDELKKNEDMMEVASLKDGKIYKFVSK